MSDATIWTPGAGEPGPVGPPGPPGDPGPAVEFRVNANWIQWRVVGTSTWINLLNTDTLVGPPGTGSTGPRGPAGNTGAKGDTGETGEPGQNGATWHETTGEPDGEVGSEDDFALDTLNGDVWIKDIEPTGWRVYMNLRGPIGPQGPPGPASVPQVRNGNGAPSGSLGIQGDFYIDVDAYFIYGPKTESGWGAGVSLVQLINSEFVNNSIADMQARIRVLEASVMPAVIYQWFVSQDPGDWAVFRGDITEEDTALRLTNNETDFADAAITFTVEIGVTYTILAVFKDKSAEHVAVPTLHLGNAATPYGGYGFDYALDESHSIEATDASLVIYLNSNQNAEIGSWFELVDLIVIAQI